MLDDVFQSAVAVVARGDHGVDSGVAELIGFHPVAFHAHALEGRAAVDDPAARAATEVVLAVGRHFDHVGAEKVHHVAQLVGKAAAADGVAGIMDGDRIFELVRDLDLAFVDFGFVHTHLLNQLFECGRRLLRARDFAAFLADFG